MKQMKDSEQVSSSLVLNSKPLGHNGLENLRKKNISTRSSEKEKEKQVISSEIETPNINVPVTEPVSSVCLRKKKRQLILPESSQSTEPIISKIDIGDFSSVEGRAEKELIEKIKYFL